MRYDRAFAIRAQRAVAHGIADVRAFQQLGVESGLSVDQVAELLQEDLENEGPIWGQFMRSLRGAATTAVEQAAKSGEILAHASQSDVLDELLELGSLDDIIDDADPETLADVEDLADMEEVMYVAMLENTCDRCLPYHGTVMTRGEWRERGIEPGPGGNMHDDWKSKCKCRFVPMKLAGKREKIMAPLRRLPKKDDAGRKISGRTVRDVAQVDIDKALAAVEKAKDTHEGRRALRWMGKAGSDE